MTIISHLIEEMIDNTNGEYLPSTTIHTPRHLSTILSLRLLLPTNTEPGQKVLASLQVYLCYEKTSLAEIYVSPHSQLAKKDGDQGSD